MQTYDRNGYVRTAGGKGSKALSDVSVTTAATQILAANANRLTATIYNNGAATVYLGKDNTVTTGNGLPLAAGQSLVDEDSSDAWYGIVASGTVDVRAVEVS